MAGRADPPRPRVREAVQHAPASGEGGDLRAVLPLIEKEPRLLASRDVDEFSPAAARFPIARRADVVIERARTRTTRSTTPAVAATGAAPAYADEFVVGSSAVEDATIDDADSARAPIDAESASRWAVPMLIAAAPAALLALVGFRRRFGRRQPSRTPARRR